MPIVKSLAILLRLSAAQRARAKTNEGPTASPIDYDRAQMRAYDFALTR